MKTIHDELKRLETIITVELNYEVSFDINSKRTLGQCAYIVKKNTKTVKKYKLRFNQKVLQHATEEKIIEVVKHEFAHMLTNIIHGINVLPHGKEWKSIMRRLGVKTPRAKTSEFTEEIKKAHKLYYGICKCQQHILSLEQYTNILNKKIKYFCNNCENKIKINIS